MAVERTLLSRSVQLQICAAKRMPERTSAVARHSSVTCAPSSADGGRYPSLVESLE